MCKRTPSSVQVLVIVLSLLVATPQRSHAGDELAEFCKDAAESMGFEMAAPLMVAAGAGILLSIGTKQMWNMWSNWKAAKRAGNEAKVFEVMKREVMSRVTAEEEKAIDDHIKYKKSCASKWAVLGGGAIGVGLTGVGAFLLFRKAPELAQAEGASNLEEYAAMQNDEKEKKLRALEAKLIAAGFQSVGIDRALSAVLTENRGSVLLDMRRKEADPDISDKKRNDNAAARLKRMDEFLGNRARLNGVIQEKVVAVLRKMTPADKSVTSDTLEHIKTYAKENPGHEDFKDFIGTLTTEVISEILDFKPGEYNKYLRPATRTAIQRVIRQAVIDGL